MVEHSKQDRFGFFYGAILVLLVGILPMSNTIALRNLLLLALTLLFFFAWLWQWWGRRAGLRIGLHDVPRSVQLWLVYLLLFPLLAVQTQLAWQNLATQWLEIVLAGVVGWGAVLVCGTRGPSLLTLAAANSAPALLHLLLTVVALLGGLSSDFYADPTLATVWQSLRHSNAQASYPALTLQQMLIGFRGVEPMHGNIGYSASQAMVLYCAYILSWARSGRVPRLWLPLLGTALCFLSIFIAQSRGAIIFGVGILLAALVLYTVAAGLGQEPAVADGAPTKPVRPWFSPARLALLVGLLGLFAATHYLWEHDARWRTMADKVSVGLEVADPVTTLCEGVSSEQEQWIRARFAERDPADVEQIILGLKGQDGGRILLLRSGLQLVLDNPRGLDGSRHTFQKLITARCGHEPVLAFSHAHNGWIDLTLALGWAGALLFALAMLTLLRCAWRGVVRNAQDGWSLALVLLVAFWLVRGLADSVYREHFLQMQWLLMLYLYARTRLEKSVAAAG